MACAAPVPSSVSKKAATFRSEQGKNPIYNGRHNRHGPPLSIYHAAFAELQDDLRDLNRVVDPHEEKRVETTAKLCTEAADIYESEDDRSHATLPYIESLLGIQIQEKVKIGTLGRKKVSEADALGEVDIRDDRFGKKTAPIAAFEFKVELGISGQCGLQNALTLRKRLAEDKVCHSPSRSQSGLRLTKLTTA